MDLIGRMEEERRVRLANRGVTEDDPPEIMALRALRDLIVTLSVKMTDAGRMAKALMVELRGERFASEAYHAGRQNDAIKAATAFASAVIKASGYGAPPPPDIIIAEEDPVPFHQMMRATSYVDAAIYHLGGEV